MCITAGLVQPATEGAVMDARYTIWGAAKHGLCSCKYGQAVYLGDYKMAGTQDARDKTGTLWTNDSGALLPCDRPHTDSDRHRDECIYWTPQSPNSSVDIRLSPELRLKGHLDIVRASCQVAGSPTRCLQATLRPPEGESGARGIAELECSLASRVHLATSES